MILRARNVDASGTLANSNLIPNSLSVELETAGARGRLRSCVGVVGEEFVAVRLGPEEFYRPPGGNCYSRTSRPTFYSSVTAHPLLSTDQAAQVAVPPVEMDSNPLDFLHRSGTDFLLKEEGAMNSARDLCSSPLSFLVAVY